MSDINTTITIKRFVKDMLEECRDFSYEHWDDVMIRLANFYLENKPNKKSDE